MAEIKSEPPPRAPAPSETVNKLRERFTPLAATLKPEDEPADAYQPKPANE